MNTRKSLISRVSVHRTIPTLIPSYDFQASGEAATTVQDAVEKQVISAISPTLSGRTRLSVPPLPKPLLRFSLWPQIRC